MQNIFPASFHFAHAVCQHPILHGYLTDLPMMLEQHHLLQLLYIFCVYIVSCSTFYEKEAMLMDPVDGPILASLLGIYKPL